MIWSRPREITGWSLIHFFEPTLYPELCFTEKIIFEEQNKQDLRGIFSAKGPTCAIYKSSLHVLLRITSGPVC